VVVHLGCDDGELTAALRISDRYLVQGLDLDPSRIEGARKRLIGCGLQGQVTARVFDGKHLPYASSTVNLLVAENLGDVAMTEALRVLAPEGVLYMQQDDAWTATTKPRPANIDEWSHFLHNASGNAVAEDREVGPPNSLRWVAEPKWCRSHEIPSSVNAVVTAGGRIFTILDEGPTGVYRGLPQACHLIARDAANGVLLWKVAMQGWQPEFGTGVGNRWNIHHTIPRRLVAQRDRVYVTLGFLDSPVSVLDASTGKVLCEGLAGTKGTDEMLLVDEILIVKITDGRSVAATARLGKDVLNDTLAAVNVRTGEQLWRHEGTRVVPYAVSAHQGKLVYHDMEHLVCLDVMTGGELWRTPHVLTNTVGAASTLVISDGIVLFHGHGQAAEARSTSKTAAIPSTAKGKKRRRFYLTALSLADGGFLWQHDGAQGLAAACTQPTDLFVAEGIVWCGGALQGRDLKSGEVRKTLTIGELISPGHHYRCHRSKATERFLIWPKRGAEFVDLEGLDHMRNDWLRAPCFTGTTPANGLLYVPPSQCFCYPGVKVSGFLALAERSASSAGEAVLPTQGRLEQGPAYGQVENAESPALPSDWPRYRRDGRMCGSTTMSVPLDLNRRWTVDLACQGTQPVIVGERLWIAEKDMHRIRCLNANTGKALWDFVAAGRIDSPPTIHAGHVLFGCTDGSVYCLRSRDGALVWRFQAAPASEQVVSFGQLESLWPVHGSVQVQDGTVYFAAGRSSFLDGGVLVYGLDVRTGEVKYQHHLEGPWPDVMHETGRPFAMEGALPDLMVSDGQDLYMQRIKFDAQLNRLETRRESDLGELDMGAMHLAATGGFLDDTGFDRVYWMYSRRWPGFYFSQQAPKSGQLVVFDDTTTYAVKYFYRRIQWSPAFLPASQGYLLFADDNANEPILEEKGSAVKAIEWLPKEAATDKHRRGGRGVEKGTGYARQHPAKWQTMIPLRARAMVLAKDRLIAAGPPDTVDPEDPFASFEGRQGAVIHVYAADSGELLKSCDLASPPVFDGMSAAGQKLFLATQDQKLICFGAPIAAASE
jgi:outer membrane protein assembly factor BamB